MLKKIFEELSVPFLLNFNLFFWLKDDCFTEFCGLLSNISMDQP